MFDLDGEAISGNEAAHFRTPYPPAIGQGDRGHQIRHSPVRKTTRTLTGVRILGKRG
jgi:hypothetical protein